MSTTPHHPTTSRRPLPDYACRVAAAVCHYADAVHGGSVAEVADWELAVEAGTTVGTARSALTRLECRGIIRYERIPPGMGAVARAAQGPLRRRIEIVDWVGITVLVRRAAVAQAARLAGADVEGVAL